MIINLSVRNSTDKYFNNFLNGMFIELFAPLEQERSIDNDEDIQATWREYLDVCQDLYNEYLELSIYDADNGGAECADVGEAADTLSMEQLAQIKSKYAKE